MKEHHRTASIFAGVYAAIQGVIWALFAIYCCAIYGCLVDFPLNLDQGHITSAYLLYVSYFRGECRIPNGLPLLTAPSAERTYYWMLIYGIVSACWLPTSVLLIVSAVNKIRGKSGVCFYVPWIINTAVIVIVDLVAFIIYAIDIKKTITVAEYEEFIENAVKVKGADGITVVPAAIMVAIFSRGILFWIINLILLGVVIQAAHSLTRRSPTEKFVQTGAKRDPVAERWKMADSNVVLSGLPRVNQKAPSPVMQRMSRSVENPISPQSPVNEEPPSPFVREPSLRRTLSASTVYDVYGRPTSEMLQDSPIFRRKPVQTLQDSPIFRRNQNESGGNLVNNQLPWSYISPQDLNTKKHELKTNKEPPKPPIPVPDYTVRHPPWTKGNLSRSNSALTPSTYKNLERQMAEKRAARHPY